MRILGIETSCDETAAAVVEINKERFSVLSNVVASQVKIHARTGGVVPEVAARAHVEKIIPVINNAIHNTRYKTQDTGEGIDAIAVTVGPGLITSLLVGVETARTLAYLWKKPLIAVNHLEGHIYANWLSPVGEIQNPKFQFPILCLIVSGGHTELVLMRKHLDYKIIGATRDDAAGECFDKVAKILNLGYPGGPAIAACADKFKVSAKSASALGGKSEKLKIKFPRPMINSNDFDFSFAGLKTAVLYLLRDFLNKNKRGKFRAAARNLPRNFSKRFLSEACYEVQEAIVDVLVAKTIAAAKKYKAKTVMLGGGVAANKRLRQRLGEAVEKELSNTKYTTPDTNYTTDNAAMIAAAGYFHTFPLKARPPLAGKKDFISWRTLIADPNLRLGETG